MLKEGKDVRDFQADDFYPIGLSARIENISEEDVVQIRTIDRVEIINPVIEDGEVQASFASRPSVEDMSDAEQQQGVSLPALLPPQIRPGIPVGTLGAGIYPAAQKRV